jgi:3-oxoacyl-[acyl-carrier protein] reductase
MEVMQMRLKGKVAIITGAGRGIGKATAETFAREGAKIVIADFDEESGNRVAEEIKATGAEAIFIKVDVADNKSARSMVEKTIDVYGHLDILVNNAGITADGWLTKMDEEAWDRVININLKGVYNCSRPAVEKMMEQGSGVILNASSVVGLYGNIGQTNYAASKFGIIGLTKTWSRELGPKGIRVNAVAPGYTMTDMMRTVPEKLLDSLKAKNPLKRLGEVEDIANAYLFLASDEASYVNGEVLSVDGGLILS